MQHNMQQYKNCKNKKKELIINIKSLIKNYKYCFDEFYDMIKYLSKDNLSIIYNFLYLNLNNNWYLFKNYNMTEYVIKLCWGLGLNIGKFILFEIAHFDFSNLKYKDLIQFINIEADLYNIYINDFDNYECLPKNYLNVNYFLTKYCFLNKKTSKKRLAKILNEQYLKKTSKFNEWILQDS